MTNTIQYQESIIEFLEIGEKAKQVISMVKALVKNENDVHEVIMANRKSDQLTFFMLNDIHKKRLAESTITKEEFVSKFLQDRKLAVEELFIESLYQSNIDEIERFDITPEEIYDLHKNDERVCFGGLLREFDYLTRVKGIAKNKEGASIRHKWESSNGKFTVVGHKFPNEIVPQVYIQLKGKAWKYNAEHLTEKEAKRIPKYVLAVCELIKEEMTSI